MALILEPHLDIDLATAPDLRAQLQRAVDDGERAIVVDLSGIGYIDSAGMGVLVGIMKQVRDEGGIAVVCPDDRMRNTFEITGLDEILNVETTREHAVAALEQRVPG